MNYCEDIKPVTYMKSRAAELLRTLEKNRRRLLARLRRKAAPHTTLSSAPAPAARTSRPTSSKTFSCVASSELESMTALQTTPASLGALF